MKIIFADLLFPTNWKLVGKTLFLVTKKNVLDSDTFAD